MKYIPVFFLLFFSTTILAQDGALSVVSWNVENLFDCKHDSLKEDYDFLPQGDYHWTPARYWRKLDNVARTLAALAENDHWPDLVGLSEVENDSVLRDLTRRSPLRTARYQYVMTDSPDQRGVDVALLYQPSSFHLLYYEGVRVPSEKHGFKPTRDILHVVGTIKQGESAESNGGDTLHVLVVHLPSQVNETAASAQNRILAAETLASVVDSLQGKCVLLMGDFNAEQKDKVFTRLSPPLVSLTEKRGVKKGSYYFRGRWSFLDHILLSSNLLARSQKFVEVADFSFLLTEEGVPWRTFRGPSYAGGFSDHLPLKTRIFTHKSK